MKILTQCLLFLFVWIVICSCFISCASNDVASCASGSPPENDVTSNSKRGEKSSLLQMIVLLPATIVSFAGMALGHATKYLKPLDGRSYFGLLLAFSSGLLASILMMKAMSLGLVLTSILFLLPLSAACFGLGVILLRHRDDIEQQIERYFPTSSLYLT